MTGPLAQVGLTALMARGAGRPEVVVGVVDGLVAVDHPGLAGGRLRLLLDGGRCDRTDADPSCHHGTFVTGLLAAHRTAEPPGICPGCTVLVRPVFGVGRSAGGGTARVAPAAWPEDLAAAVVETVDAGARVLNLSVAPERPSSAGHRELEWALDHAADRGVITVVAAGNQGTIGTSVLTRHPWTVPVVAYDRQGRPMSLSNLGGSIGGHGLGAPGEAVAGLGIGGRPLALTGTSAAVPFVAGTVALLLSEFPSAPPAEVRAAVLRTGTGSVRRRTVVPPLLDARAAYSTLHAAYGAPHRGAVRGVPTPGQPEWESSSDARPGR